MIRFAAAAAAAALLTGAALPALAGSAPAPVHHDLRVSLDPESGKIDVTDRVRVSGRGAAVLRLPPGFVMGRISIGGPGVRLRKDDEEWRLSFEDPSGGEASLGFRGTLAGPIEGAGGPRRAFAVAEGSYLPGRGGWYADFADMALTYTLDVDVPEDQRAVAPGRLVSEEIKDGRYRARFAFDQPAEDIALMAGPYEVTERFHGELRLRTYFHREIADLAPPYLDKTVEYLDLYEAWIGPYPFSAFHIVSSPLPVGLGLPGLTYMGIAVLRLPFIRDTSLGHEVLHNWWGNGVYVDDRFGNWAEGLTTFMADYAFAERRGAAAARDMRVRWLRDFAAVPAGRAAPVRDFRARRHGAARVIGYNKAAMLFLMLRDEIGRAAFDSAIRAFWAAYKFRRASWDHLRRAFEEGSGRDLGRFFDQWLSRAGAPRLSLRNVTVSRADTGYDVTLTLMQDAPAYALSVPVTIETRHGARHFRVPLEDRIERLTLTTDAKPLALEVDPDATLFRRLDADEVPPILRHVMLDPATVTVIATNTAEAEDAGRDLAGRLLEAGARVLDAGDDTLLAAPLLVVGTTGRVGAVLERLGLPGAPARVRGRGTARVWSARRGDGQAAVIVEADDGLALSRLARPLPHYGAKSFLVFEQGKAIDHGVWPPETRPLRVELD